MKSNRLFAAAALVILISVGAHADNVVAGPHQGIPGQPSRVATLVRSNVDRASVRSQAAGALRLGKPRGEGSAI